MAKGYRTRGTAMSRTGRIKTKLRELKKEGIVRSVKLEKKSHVLPVEKFTPDENGKYPEEKDRTETFNYEEAISGILLRSEQPGGLTYSDLKHCDKINEAIEAAVDGEMLLEEADYEYLKNKVTNFRFRAWSRFVVQFVDDITNAPQVQIEKKEPES